MAEQIQAPTDMTVRERCVYLGLLDAQEASRGSHSPADVLARYIARTEVPWRVAAERVEPQTVRVSVALLAEVAQALMGLDARLVRGLEDAIENGEYRPLSERLACAQEWVDANGFDKHGVAEWLRSGSASV